MNKFQNKSLFNKVPRVEGLLKRNFSLSNLTWFKVGGKAEIYFLPKNIDDLINFFEKFKKRNSNKNIGSRIKYFGEGWRNRRGYYKIGKKFF